MQDVMTRLIDVPMARMFVLAGIIFLLVAVLGRIEGKIEPGNIGRVGASIVGTLLMIVGLAVYFFEGETIRDRLRESLPAMSPAGAAKSAPNEPSGTVMRDAPAEGKPAAPSQMPAAAAKTAGAEIVKSDKPVIKITAGTYGGNCGGKPGNATAALARTCDGRALCDYKIDISALEDPAPSCDKNYTAEWKCGSGSNVYLASLSAGASRGGQLMLACPGS